MTGFITNPEERLKSAQENFALISRVLFEMHREMNDPEN